MPNKYSASNGGHNGKCTTDNLPLNSSTPQPSLARMRPRFTIAATMRMSPPMKAPEPSPHHCRHHAHEPPHEGSGTQQRVHPDVDVGHTHEDQHLGKCTPGGNGGGCMKNGELGKATQEIKEA